MHKGVNTTMDEGQTMVAQPIAFDCKGSEPQADESGVAPTLRAMAHSGSHANAGGQLAVAHALRGEGFDASEDGTGRGTPIVPVAVAFDAQAGGNTGLAVGEDVAGTLHGGGKHGGRAAVAFAENSRAELRLCGGDGQVAAQLTTGGGKPGQGQPVIAFQERGGRADGRRVEFQEDVSYALTAPSGGGRAQERNIATRCAVRRLTPRECERLQGFPDGYTDVPYRRRNFTPDGPRYKALGNSMAVNAMEWLGERIALVDDLIGGS